MYLCMEVHISIPVHMCICIHVSLYRLNVLLVLLACKASGWASQAPARSQPLRL